MRVWLLLLFVASARGQVLVNGGFEDPNLSVTLNLSGSFLLPGWSGLGASLGGNAGLVVGGAPEGNQFFVFNGGNPSDRGWVEQSFAVVPGQRYVVEFQVGRIGGLQDLRLLGEVWGSSGLLGGGEFLAPGSAGFGVQRFEFVASDSVARLRFTDVSGGNSISDLGLDGVSVAMVEAVPEPGVWVLMLGGVAWLIGARWRPSSAKASEGSSWRGAPGE